MADKVKITDADGNDVEIATDDAGASGQVQLVKLGYSADGSAVALLADVKGLKVQNPTTASDFYVTANGVVAHDSPAVGNPVRIGSVYKAAPPKVSADNDIVNLALTQDGKILDMHSAPAAATTNVNTNYSSAQTNAVLVTAPGANKRLVIVSVVYTKGTAGTMKLVEDPLGTPVAKFGPHYFPDNGGMVDNREYIPLTTNKALGITTTGGGNETITVRVITEEV